MATPLARRRAQFSTPISSISSPLSPFLAPFPDPALKPPTPSLAGRPAPAPVLPQPLAFHFRSKKRPERLSPSLQSSPLSSWTPPPEAPQSSPATHYSLSPLPPTPFASERPDDPRPQSTLPHSYSPDRSLISIAARPHLYPDRRKK